ncbi:MAG TPA: hypothetical protein VJQ46_01700 [Gemmatimonadales bacterium]|nr:hypothetical protein [Gemmatimonadales bacterium]
MQVSAFGRISRQLAQVAADRIQLPQGALLHTAGLVARQHTIDQAGDQVGAKGETRGKLALPLVLVPRTLQERRVAQDIGRRLDLTEELLRREQIASFR